MRIVMGIDPGIANTGFGVVRACGQKLTALDGGTIEVSAKMTIERRLQHIHESLNELLDWHEPEALALEAIYFGKNVRSANAVGQARGVVMLAAAEREIPCFDYTPQAVKMSVCGTGRADKEQVMRMVATLLQLPVMPRSDHAADALAVAICHAAHSASAIAQDDAAHPARAQAGVA